jgi:hypothetical protein
METQTDLSWAIARPTHRLHLAADLYRSTFQRKTPEIDSLNNFILL